MSRPEKAEYYYHLLELTSCFAYDRNDLQKSSFNITCIACNSKLLIKSYTHIVEHMGRLSHLKNIHQRPDLKKSNDLNDNNKINELKLQIESLNNQILILKTNSPQNIANQHKLEIQSLKETNEEQRKRFKKLSDFLVNIICNKDNINSLHESPEENLNSIKQMQDALVKEKNELFNNNKILETKIRDNELAMNCLHTKINSQKEEINNLKKEKENLENNFHDFSIKLKSIVEYFKNEFNLQEIELNELHLDNLNYEEMIKILDNLKESIVNKHIEEIQSLQNLMETYRNNSASTSREEIIIYDDNNNDTEELLYNRNIIKQEPFDANDDDNRLFNVRKRGRPPGSLNKKITSAKQIKQEK
jgi:chromosome segregation ATPase